MGLVSVMGAFVRGALIVMGLDESTCLRKWSREMKALGIYVVVVVTAAAVGMGLAMLSGVWW
jgi:hypothetical protein